MSQKTLSRRVLFRISLLFLLIAAVLSPSTPVTAANVIEPIDVNIREFQLFPEGHGWLWMGEQLFQTDDHGSTWRTSTPAAENEILDVVFLDAQNAWVVANQNHVSQFVLANTSDGGQVWESKAYDFSELAQMPSAVAEVHMGWRNVLDGWLVFELATGSNFSVGILYTTQDGGDSWQVHEIPLGEPAIFIDSKNGWVAGGPNGKLYRTQDGGETWQEQSPAGSAYYQLPIFADDQNGFVTAVTAEQDSVSAEILQTGDAGQTWTSAGRVPLQADTPSDVSLPLSVIDATHVTLVIPNSEHIVQRNDGQLAEIQNEDGQSANILALQMVSSQNGWAEWSVGNCDTDGNPDGSLVCRRETGLLSTKDGGRHWQPVRLPETGQTSVQQNFSVPNKNNSESSINSFAISDPDTEAYVGQGFDKCEVPTLSQMQKWWTSSPYNAVNLYIGGSARACYNSALSLSFVSQLNAQGWRFIPTWVGPQASCAGYLSRMSSDPSVAYEQGRAEADLAADTARNLGLTEADGSGTIIYYDLEAYDTSNANCRNAANEFISGWVAQMRARGNLGGVYGASCASAVTDWASITNVPDALWIANWYGNAGAVSYRPTASVWGAYCLSDSLWSNHQRLRQYAGGHNETWGGITLGIDSNAIDGPLTVSNGTADQSAPSQPLNVGPVQATVLSRTNDTWLTWKTNGDSCSVHIWGGSMDSTVTANCSTYRLGVKPGGTYSWQVTSSNAAGTTLGPVWQFKVKPHAPTNASISAVFATKVNLSWQLSADDPGNVDGYNIYRNDVNIATVNKSITSYQVTNLACNTAYSFYVKSVRQGVESDATSTVTGTTTTCAPVLVSPIAGVVLQNRRPAFTWQAVDLATAYQIQVSSSPTFSTLALNAQVATLNYAMTKDLASNILYYWRVRGVGSFGYGDWSAAESFTTANPPSIPALSAPANGGLTTNYTPKLNWTDSVLPSGTGLAHYQIQVASDNTFTNKLYDQPVTVSEFVIPGALLPNSKYYWRVQAFNTLGQYASWTPTWSFRTAVVSPALASPADGFVFNHLRPAFQWNDVSGATRYTIQISRYQNFSSILIAKTPIASQYESTTDLPRNTLLYWRVRTEAVNGPSQWSASRTFRTGNPPYIPALLSPASNALVTSYQPKLDWGDVTLPAGTTLDHYQIQVAKDAGFTVLEWDADVTASHYNPATPLDPNTKYYWRVRAFNTLGHFSAWSAPRYFRAAMLAPVLVAPANNATPSVLRPPFSWQTVTGATSYTIQISRYSNFSSLLAAANVPTAAYTPGFNLPGGVTLYWRVRANGANGPSLWSSVYQFTIQ